VEKTRRWLSYRCIDEVIETGGFARKNEDGREADGRREAGASHLGGATASPTIATMPAAKVLELAADPAAVVAAQ